MTTEAPELVALTSPVALVEALEQSALSLYQSILVPEDIRQKLQLLTKEGEAFTLKVAALASELHRAGATGMVNMDTDGEEIYLTL